MVIFSKPPRPVGVNRANRPLDHLLPLAIKSVNGDFPTDHWTICGHLLPLAIKSVNGDFLKATKAYRCKSCEPTVGTIYGHLLPFAIKSVNGNFLKIYKSLSTQGL